MAGSLGEDIATVAELAKVVGSRGAALRLLETLGIAVIEDVFSRLALNDALLRRSAPFDASGDPAAQRLDISARGVAALRRALAVFDLDVGSVAQGKALGVTIVAPTASRQLVGVDTGEIERIHFGSEPVDARVYVAARLRAGTPQFTASGFLSEKAPPIYLYVLLEPERVWVTTRQDLCALHKDLGKRRKSERRFAAARFGFARHPKRPGTLRIWMPQGTRTGLDLSERVADEDGMLLLRGGRS